MILTAKDLIVHLQIADPPERGFPMEKGNEPRYRKFFGNLPTIGYTGRFSVEASASHVPGVRAGADVPQGDGGCGEVAGAAGL